MHHLTLYGITVLIWGSTWLAITFQLGNVPVIASVAYRFSLAAVLLLAWCRWRRLALPHGVVNQAWLALMGFCYSINYLLVYHTESYLSSGLVAVGLSSTLIFNLVLARLFFNIPLTRDLLLGLSLGLIGVVLVFWPEFNRSFRAAHDYTGLISCLIAALAAACANMIALRNQKAGIDTLPMNANWMAWMGIFVLAYGAINRVEFTFDWSLTYIGSMLYLIVFGSIIAFASYLTLLKRIGAERASYVSVLTPIVALALSTLFEGFKWETISLVGVVLTIVGNVLVIQRRASTPKSAMAAAPLARPLWQK